MTITHKIGRRWLRITAFAVTCLFFFNSLVWANPDVFLQPLLFTAAPGDSGILEKALADYVRGIQSPIDEINCHFFPTINGKRVDIYFDRKRKGKDKWTIPCVVGSTNYNADITPGNYNIEIYEPEAKLFDFVRKSGFAYGTASDGSLHEPTPYYVLVDVFSRLKDILGTLDGKSFLDFGCGDLRAGLIASYLDGMKVTAVEKDRNISSEARPVFEKALKEGFISVGTFDFKEATDALSREVDWSAIDLALLFYTEPLEYGGEDSYRASIINKIKTMKPGGVMAMIFTHAQISMGLDEFPGLDTEWPKPEKIFDKVPGYYLQIYKAPQKNTGAEDYVRKNTPGDLSFLPEEPNPSGLSAAKRIVLHTRYIDTLYRTLARFNAPPIWATGRDNKVSLYSWRTYCDTHGISTPTSVILMTADLWDYDGPTEGNYAEITRRFADLRARLNIITSLATDDLSLVRDMQAGKGTENDPIEYASLSRYFLFKIFVDNREAAQNRAIFYEISKRLSLSLREMDSAIRELRMPASIEIAMVSFTATDHPQNSITTALYSLSGTLKRHLAKLEKPCAANVKIFDMYADHKLTVDSVAANIISDKPRIVTFSLALGTLVNAEALFKRIGEIPETERPLVIIGGALVVHHDPELLKRKFPGAVIVAGDGEEPLCKIAEMASDSTVETVRDEIKKLPWVVPSHETRILPAGTQASYLLQTKPFRDIGLTDIDALIAAAKRGAKVYLEASRGCPWGRCEYCVYEAGGKKPYRPRKPSDVVTEVDRLAANGIYAFDFADEEFVGVGFIDHALEIARGIQESSERYGKNVSFNISCRANSVWNSKDTPETAEKRALLFRELKKAGLAKIFLGVESGSPTQLARYNKGLTIEEIERAVGIVRGMGIEIEVGFIMFDPDVTLAEIKDNLAFLERNSLLNNVSWFLNELRIQAGSRMEEKYRTDSDVNMDEFPDESAKTYSHTYANHDVDKLVKVMKEAFSVDMHKVFYHIKSVVRRGTIGLPEKEVRAHGIFLKYRDLLIAEFMSSFSEFMAAADNCTDDAILDAKYQKEILKTRLALIRLIRNMSEELREKDLGDIEAVDKINELASKFIDTACLKTAALVINMEGMGIGEASNVDIIVPPPVPPEDYQNYQEIVCWVKPGGTFTPDVMGEILKNILATGYSLEGISIFSGKRVKELKIFEKLHPLSFRVARKGAELFDAGDMRTMREIYKYNLDDLPIIPAYDLRDKYGMNENDIIALWESAYDEETYFHNETPEGIKRIGRGKYVATVTHPAINGGKPFILVNGVCFQLKEMEQQENTIALFLRGKKGTSCDSVAFRENIVGNDIPSRCKDGSIRKLYFDRQLLKSPDKFRFYYKIVGMGSGPIETLLASKLWFNKLPNDGTVFGRMLKNAGFSDSDIDALIKEQIVETPGGKDTISGLIEKMDPPEALAFLKTIPGTSKAQAMDRRQGEAVFTQTKDTVSDKLNEHKEYIRRLKAELEAWETSSISFIGTIGSAKATALKVLSRFAWWLSGSIQVVIDENAKEVPGMSGEPEIINGPALFPAAGTDIENAFFQFDHGYFMPAPHVSNLSSAHIIFNDISYVIQDGKVYCHGLDNKPPEVLFSMMRRYDYFKNSRIKVIEHKKTPNIEYITYELRLGSGELKKLTFVAGDMMKMELKDLGLSSLGMVFASNMGWSNSLGGNGTFWLKIHDMLSDKGIVVANYTDFPFTDSNLGQTQPDPHDQDALILFNKRGHQNIYRADKKISHADIWNHAVSSSAHNRGEMLAFLGGTKAMDIIFRDSLSLRNHSLRYLLTAENLEFLKKKLKASVLHKNEELIFSYIAEYSERQPKTDLTDDEIRILRGLIEIEETLLKNINKSRLNVTTLPDGSPWYTFNLLRTGFKGDAVDSETIRQHTKGRMPDKHLSQKTVERDLKTLLNLKLVKTEPAPNGTLLYRVVNISPDEWFEVSRELSKLGDRPTKPMKAAAKAAILAFIPRLADSGSPEEAYLNTENARPQRITTVDPIVARISRELSQKNKVMVLVDGNPGTGKTSVVSAGIKNSVASCSVISLDSYVADGGRFDIPRLYGAIMTAQAASNVIVLEGPNVQSALNEISSVYLLGIDNFESPSPGRAVIGVHAETVDEAARREFIQASSHSQELLESRMGCRHWMDLSNGYDFVFTRGSGAVPRIGKKAYVISVDPNKRNAVVTTGSLATKDLTISPCGRLEWEKLRNSVSETSDIETGHRDILLAIVGLLENSPPEFYTFDALLGDLLGFVSREHSLMAIYKGLDDNMVARFHEAAHYLIASERLRLEISGTVLTISSDRGQIARLTLSPATLAERASWPRKWENDSHYLLRVLQRELFGRYDEEFTQRIRDVLQPGGMSSGTGEAQGREKEPDALFPDDNKVLQRVQETQGSEARRMLENSPLAGLLRHIVAQILTSITERLSPQAIINLFRLAINRVLSGVLYLVYRFSDRAGIAGVLNRLQLGDPDTQGESFSNIALELHHAAEMEDRRNVQVVAFTGDDDKGCDLIIRNESGALEAVEVQRGAGAAGEAPFNVWINTQIDQKLLSRMNAARAGIFACRGENPASMIFTFNRQPWMDNEAMPKIERAVRDYVERSAGKEIADGVSILPVDVEEKGFLCPADMIRSAPSISNNNIALQSLMIRTEEETTTALASLRRHLVPAGIASAAPRALLTAFLNHFGTDDAAVTTIAALLTRHQASDPDGLNNLFRRVGLWANKKTRSHPDALEADTAVRLLRSGINDDAHSIGKRTKVQRIDTAAGIAMVTGSSGTSTLALEAHGNLDIQSIASAVKAMNGIEKRHRDIVLSMIGLLEKSPPRLYTFDALIGDLFAFASPSRDIIALHKTLADDPVAKFHEIGEYLVHAGQMDLKLSGMILTVSVGGKKHTLALGDEARTIAAKNPKDPHYLIRALQREVFKGRDRDLTGTIKEKLSAAAKTPGTQAEQKSAEQLTFLPDTKTPDIKEFRDLLGYMISDPLFSWGKTEDKLSAAFGYSVISREFDISPTDECRSAHPELELLDAAATDLYVPSSGLFGVLRVNIVQKDGEYGLWFREVHPSIGYRQIKPREARIRTYGEWSRGAIEHVISLAQKAGFKHFYASTGEEIKGEYLRRLKTRILDSNLLENYVIPFRQGWEETSAEVHGRERKLWRKTESETTPAAAAPKTITVSRSNVDPRDMAELTIAEAPSTDRLSRQRAGKSLKKGSEQAGDAAKQGKAAQTDQSGTLRNIRASEELAVNLIEHLLSIATTKKVVLAFDKEIAACQSGNPSCVFDMLVKLKDDDRYKRILSNLEIISAAAEALPSAVEKYSGQKNTEVFVFAKEDARPGLRSLESAVHSTYINEEGFPSSSYYPLAEVVVLALNRYFYDYLPKGEMNTAIYTGKTSIVLKDLNIESITAEGGVLIFKLLPDAEPCETRELIKRYAELKRFLKAA